VRAADISRLEAALEREAPGATAIYSDPTPQEKVPVSLSTPKLVKPVRFLIDMFGLPDYFSFDPTPYLALSFLTFFGMCFGDVVYGIMLCAIAGYLAMKARKYEGLHNFCMLFFYCGISTIIFGVLTGSWASDLWKPEYLGEGNPLLWLKERTALIDPLDKAVLLLVICVGIGVVNQLYGIALRGYGLLRRGDVAGALFDAGLWLIMLPGFVIVAAALFTAEPKWLFRLGLGMMAAAGIGLVLTQGRQEKGFLAKFLTGLVSLYGIMGSYGCVSFIGDTLSYTRLLALGLTTSIVGMSFNIIAKLVREIPAVGLILFIAVVIFGHLFNFAVSLLGSFVHPARLIFLEFFGRFYEAGGQRFKPLSLDTHEVVVEAES
jgi:V/A-type H+-transporting ATPase subunit I